MTVSTPARRVGPRSSSGRTPGAAQPARAPRTKRSSSTTQKVVWGIVGVVALAAAMEIISRSGIVNPAFLPPFSTVAWESVMVWGREDFRADVVATVSAYVLGMLISVAIAAPVGILFGLSRVSYRMSRATIELVRTLPPVALIPLAVLILGNGLGMKLAIVVFAALWPIMFNAMYGVHGVDPRAKEMGRSFGLSRFAVIRRIVIPAAAPFIATGVRISSSIALIVLVSVELIAGGAEGIGAFVARNRAIGNEVALVYAGTLMAGFVGLVINLCLGAAERRWFRWSTTTKEA